MNDKLRGIIPPMTTPFDQNGSINEEAFREEICFLLSAGVDGLAVGGSTGEGHTLTTQEVRRLTEITVQEVENQVPVIAGIIADSTREVIERANIVKPLGVAALQITPVHYLFTPDEEGMYNFYRSIAQEIGIPILIYNVIPWSYAAPPLLTRMVNEIDAVIGIKQSAGDMHALAELLIRLDGKGLVFAAVDDLLYPCFSLGSHGSIAAILTAVPELCLDLWKAVEQEDHQAARGLHEKLFIVWQALSGPNLPACVKAALDLQGLQGGLPRSPMRPPSEGRRDAIRKALQKTGVI